jgi:hypothetical protein
MSPVGQTGLARACLFEEQEKWRLLVFCVD